MGFNAVSFDTFWGMHEPKRGLAKRRAHPKRTTQTGTLYTVCVFKMRAGAHAYHKALHLQDIADNTGLVRRLTRQDTPAHGHAELHFVPHDGAAILPCARICSCSRLFIQRDGYGCLGYVESLALTTDTDGWTNRSTPCDTLSPILRAEIRPCAVKHPAYLLGDVITAR